MYVIYIYVFIYIYICVHIQTTFTRVTSIPLSAFHGEVVMSNIMVAASDISVAAACDEGFWQILLAGCSSFSLVKNARPSRNGSRDGEQSSCKTRGISVQQAPSHCQ